MKKDKTNDVTRRKFLGQMSCAAVGSTAMYSTLLNMLTANRLSAQTLPPVADYKATVCLFLSGGNDSFNMLVPRENSEYADYSDTRAELAIAQGELLPITDASSGRAFGLHPSMTEMQALYNSGDLAFVCNTGTLVQPTTLDDWDNDRVPLPLGLFSHSDQIMHWQTSTPDRRDSVGWLGRAADLLESLSPDAKVSMNISLSGSNIMQTGNNVVPYTVTERGAIALRDYNLEGNQFFRGPTDSLLDHEYQNLLQRTYARANRSAIDLGIEFNQALGDPEDLPFSTEFPDTRLGRELRMIVRTIAGRDPLGLRRQSFFSFGWGWDHHDNLLTSHSEMLGEVSQAVSAFWSALGELGLQDSVTLFSASDFGRTLTSNGDGTDHAWGGNQFVLGGGLNGGRLYGDYPESLALGNNLDTGRGRLIPTTSADEYFAELALWLGAQRSDLTAMLPNLDRFYDPSSVDDPLGMWN